VALTAAETGHLVFREHCHTQDAAQTIDRSSTFTRRTQQDQVARQLAAHSRRESCSQTLVPRASGTASCYRHRDSHHDTGHR